MSRALGRSSAAIALALTSSRKIRNGLVDRVIGWLPLSGQTLLGILVHGKAAS
jgi:hypothetical protein